MSHKSKKIHEDPSKSNATKTITLNAINAQTFIKYYHF